VVKRIAALVLIFLCTSAAWIILGTTIFSRTYSFDSGLREAVVSTWGAPQEQSPPTASYEVPSTKTVQVLGLGTRTVKETAPVFLPLESSRIDVAINLEPRQKGLLWYRTYKVAFAGNYTYRNTADSGAR
jgi:hypothetical protein